MSWSILNPGVSISFTSIARAVEELTYVFDRGILLMPLEDESGIPAAEANERGRPSVEEEKTIAAHADATTRRNRNVIVTVNARFLRG